MSQINARVFCSRDQSHPEGDILLGHPSGIALLVCSLREVSPIVRDASTSLLFIRDSVTHGEPIDTRFDSPSRKKDTL